MGTAGFSTQLHNVVVLISEYGNALQCRNERFALHADRTGEAFRNQLAIAGIGAFQRAAGEHLIGPEEHHLTAITEQADGLLRGSSGQQALQFPQGSGRHGHGKGFAFLLTTGGVATHRQAVAIGGGKFQAPLLHLQMNAGEDLFRFIAAARKQRAAKPIRQGFTAQQQRLSILSQGQIRKILSG